MGTIMNAPPAQTQQLQLGYGGNTGSVPSVGGFIGSGRDEFAVTLQQVPGVKLGLSVNGEDGQRLLVEKINEGLITRNNQANPGQCVREGDVIVEVNGRRGFPKELIEQIQNFGGAPIRLVFKRSEVYVQLMVPEGQQLGLQVDSDGMALTISRIHPGAMDTWNQANPGSAIRPRDRIVAVNGKRGNARVLLEETKKKGSLALSVVRATM